MKSTENPEFEVGGSVSTYNTCTVATEPALGPILSKVPVPVQDRQNCKVPLV